MCRSYSLVFILCMYLYSLAQYNTFTPFSRYGIGDVQDNTSAYQKAMGNTGMAMPADTTAPSFVNILNPASLSFIRLTVLEAGGNYYHTQILNKQNYKVQQKSVNFNSLILAFPIKKYSGFSFGLLPHSFVGYQIVQNENISNIGNVNYVYDGSGGLNKVYVAYGFSLSKYFKSDTTHRTFKQLIKNLSIGTNLYYLFGELAQTATVNYPSNTLYYHFVNDRRYRINGVTADFGVQTHIRLKDDNRMLCLGGVFSYPSKLKVFNDYIAYNFSYNYFGERYIVDTLLYAENEAGKLKLPPVIGGGVSYIVANKWGVNADIKYSDWKSFYLINSPTNVTNSVEVNLGAYYQPDRFAAGKNNYAGKIIYRAGMGYNSGYQEYQNKSVPAYAFSAGVSLPMGLYRAFSAMHISVQYIRRGNKNFVLRENILKVNIGITLNDRWFIKYKYD